MKLHHSPWELLGAALLLLTGALLFFYSKESTAAATAGIQLCCSLLIPALFPFFVLSSLLISTGLAVRCAKKLGGLMPPLFGISPVGAIPFSLGLIGGYPSGARILAQLVQCGTCSQTEAKRLALFCNNCGPSFLLSFAGAGIFGSPQAGYLLVAGNLFSAVLIGLGLHWFFGPVAAVSPTAPSRPPLRSLSAQLPESVADSFSATLQVCAYVILFSVLTTLCQCSGLLDFFSFPLSALLPGPYTATLSRSLLIGLGELSTGIASLSPAIPSYASLPLAAFLLGWGGLSVHCQSLPFFRQSGISPKPYLISKLIQGLLAAGFVFCFQSLVSFSVPAVSLPSVRAASQTLIHQEWCILLLSIGLYSLIFQKRVEKPQ